MAVPSHTMAVPGHTMAVLGHIRNLPTRTSGVPSKILLEEFSICYN